MSGKWLRSGLRRDICVVVAGADEPTAQECKAALESRYDDRIEPKTFYGALDALTDAGYLDQWADGLHDRYRLTDAGKRTLREQYAWMRDILD
ncbi:PadR family transcriptional regulator [Haloplanus aerogenes]|uniref:PadR family transcriptional regulator n=1 Tax=Haloplanus aerogenes TaxID=660522 RepID=A0A3M0CIG0_9EURY|nr:PadR family transcriptional regulator [Haloplanus aerogenes]AZH26816.1 PadR family transcriptional regulator [Haloplanus aerogenes]RMB09092.1 DNA-binding PadR family transcriptional regulator [Haloplanus aerogenes]